MARKPLHGARAPLLDPTDPDLEDVDAKGPGLKPKGKLATMLAKPGSAATLARVLEIFIKRSNKPVFEIGEPCSVTVKGRKWDDNHWHVSPCIGGEEVKLDSAYVMGGQPCITAVPQGEYGLVNAFVRFPLGQAMRVLTHFESDFSSFLDSLDDTVAGNDLVAALKRAELEEFERKKMEHGNNPDFGSW